MKTLRDEIQDVLTSLDAMIKIVEVYREACGDECDHSVNVCYCGEAMDLERAKETLESALLRFRSQGIVLK